MTGGVGAAVSAQRSLRVELLEALLVRGNATVSPYLLALEIQRRADAVITIPVVVGARIPVLLVDVRRALAGLAGAHLRKIAFVGRFPAHDATREQLHNFQNRSRLDPSRGSPNQWSRSSGSSSGEGRKRNLDLPIYLPSSNLYTRAFCPLPFIDAFIVLVAIGHVHLWAERGGGREEDGGVECLTWNVSKIVGPSDRNWKIAERERRRRGEGREGEREEVECRREIFYLTIAAARTGRALRFGGESAGDRIAAGVVLVTLLDRSAITLLSLVDYPVSARSPHFDLK